jgi:hypothetical protein
LAAALNVLTGASHGIAAGHQSRKHQQNRQEDSFHVFLLGTGYQRGSLREKVEEIAFRVQQVVGQRAATRLGQAVK